MTTDWCLLHLMKTDKLVLFDHKVERYSASEKKLAATMPRVIKIKICVELREMTITYSIFDKCVCK